MRQGSAQSGARREQKSTQLPGSLGSQIDGGSASGSTNGAAAPRPTHQTQPSGRSTQRTSRESVCATAALDARACSSRERRQAPVIASDERDGRGGDVRGAGEGLRQTGLVVKDESV